MHLMLAIRQSTVQWSRTVFLRRRGRLIAFTHARTQMAADLVGIFAMLQRSWSGGSGVVYALGADRQR